MLWMRLAAQDGEVFSRSRSVQHTTSQCSSFQTTSVKLCSFSSASKDTEYLRSQMPLNKYTPWNRQCLGKNHIKSSFLNKGTNRLCFSPWAVTATPSANILKDIFQALSLCTLLIFPGEEYAWLHLQKKLYPQPWAMNFSTSPPCTLGSPALTSKSCGCSSALPAVL